VRPPATSQSPWTQWNAPPYSTKGSTPTTLTWVAALDFVRWELSLLLLADLKRLVNAAVGVLGERSGLVLQRRTHLTPLGPQIPTRPRVAATCRDRINGRPSTPTVGPPSERGAVITAVDVYSAVMVGNRPESTGLDEQANTLRCVVAQAQTGHNRNCPDLAIDNP
jgi:hypothetical protein